MNSAELMEAFELLETSTAPRSEPYAATGATDDLIVAAEARLGVKFPSSYRSFLARYGQVDFGSSEFMGLLDLDFDATRHICVVSATLHSRAVGGLDPSYVVIFIVGEGTKMVLDTSRMKGDECPVLAWRHKSASTEKVHRDYGEFLLERVTWEIEHHE